MDRSSQTTAELNAVWGLRGVVEEAWQEQPHPLLRAAGSASVGQPTAAAPAGEAVTPASQMQGGVGLAAWISPGAAARTTPTPREAVAPSLIASPPPPLSQSSRGAWLRKESRAYKGQMPISTPPTANTQTRKTIDKCDLWGRKRTLNRV